MASLSVPPPPAPTSTRLDWGHGERGSAFRGASRGRGSANRGDRGRGGRGGRRGAISTRGSKAHGSPPAASDNTKAPTTTTGPAKSAQPSAVPSTNTSTSTSTKNPSSLPRPPPILDLPPKPKPKVSVRRASQHAANNLPSLTVEPASPTVNLSGSAPQSASTSYSRPTARRQRSHNKPPGPTLSSENLTVEALTSVMKARKSRTSPSSPQGPPKASASKDAPPHLSAGPTVTSFSTKTNIDSLVEHVRALAMDHRPSTPGSHIDWAGDEDDSLPDLDDWGVSPGSGTPADANPGPLDSIEKARLQLMSPILDDSLKQLPHSFDKTSPSPSAGSGPPSPHVADTAPIPEVNGLEDSHITAVSDSAPSPIEADEREDQAPRSSEPSPTEDTSPEPEPEPATTSKDKDEPPHVSSADSVSPAPTPSTPPQSGRGLEDSIHAPARSERASSEAPPETNVSEFEFEVGKRGLAASIHAPKSSGSSETHFSDPAPEPHIPTHGRSRTLGRPPAFAKNGFLSGSSTPATAARAGTAKGSHHARTQSTPASRQRHGRPVLTTDAMSRLARTLGTAPPNKKEVVVTNLAE
ncbi:hypothetical protein EI94DRAFT_1784517 [Lactarius quietus]|nr:hypothetical protein EI94DRAFT_1784517 [Lactarius quietus]